MPDNPEDNGSNASGTGPNDTGVPLEFLEGMTGETSSQFLEKVNLKIHRRVVASHFLSLFWDIPRIVFPEIWALVVEQTKADKEG